MYRIVVILMNKILKVVLGLIVIVIILGNSNYIYATDVFSFEEADKFLEKAREPARDKNGEIIQEPEFNREVLQVANSTIFNVLFTSGIAISVIVGGILGITFMLASAEDKAKIKEMLIPYVIGCVVVFGAWGIWKFTLSIMERI